MPGVIPPAVDKDDAYFWQGVSEERLLLQQCSSCQTLRHPPIPMCGRCHSLQWHTHPAAGRGVVHSWILSHHPTQPDAEPRVVVLVELDEGLRFVSNLCDVAIDDVRNEMRVEVCFRELDGVLLPQFRPSEG